MNLFKTISLSKRGVIRGLHLQINFAQAKLVRVLEGEILDVVVDLRKKSPTLGSILRGIKRRK
jgi:dTDP-4-dehydrorhamnose 3,5-epimerase